MRPGFPHDIQLVRNINQFPIFNLFVALIDPASEFTSIKGRVIFQRPADGIDDEM